MVGYHDAPDETAVTIDDDGWLHTGDLGRMDDRGYLAVEGRLKEMIIRGGENVYPREIEEVLSSHPDVAVVGVPDDHWGEQVAAAICLRPVASMTGADLTTFCGPLLAPHKIPKIWSLVDEFPLTASGKIRKNLVRGELVTGR